MNAGDRKSRVANYAHRFLLCFCITAACFLLLARLASADHLTLRNDSFNTLPDTSSSSFRTDSPVFWDHEAAQREGEHFRPFIYSGGIHTISSTLISAAFATVAYVPERVSQSSAAITYSASANDRCWTIISSDNDGITGWTRVGSTAYYYRCGAALSLPSLPPNSAWLMRIEVTGTPPAITTVAPLYSTNPRGPLEIYFTDPAIGGICDGATDDSSAFTRAANLLGSRAGARFYLPSGTCFASWPSAMMTVTGAIGLTVEGAGIWESRNGADMGTRIRQAGTGGGFVFLTGTGDLRPTGITVKNMSFITSTGAKALDFENCNQCLVTHVNTDGWLDHTIDFRGGNTLYNEVAHGRFTGDRTSAGLTSCRIINALAGTGFLVLRHNYFNGAGATNTQGCSVTVDAGATYLHSEFNAFDRTPEAIRTSGPITSLHDWFETTNSDPVECPAGGCAALIHYNKTNNSTIAIIAPDGTTLDDPTQVTFGGSDRRYITFIGGSLPAPERGIRGGVTVESQLTPPALTADVNDYAPTGHADVSIMRLNAGGSDRNITGLAGGVTGRIVKLVNIGTSNTLTLVNQSTSSVVANRFRTNVQGFDHTIVDGATAILRYDGVLSRWDVINGSSTLPQHFHASPTINFGAPAVIPGCSTTQIDATGVRAGDRVSLAPVTVANVTDNHFFLGKVIANDLVRVSVCQFEGAAADPDGAGSVYRIDIWRN